MTAKGKTPGIVIAGFICAFLCPLIGIILCAIGMGKAKEAGAGEGLAKAGLIIGILRIVIDIIYVVSTR